MCKILFQLINVLQLLFHWTFSYNWVIQLQEHEVDKKCFGECWALASRKWWFWFIVRGRCFQFSCWGCLCFLGRFKHMLLAYPLWLPVCITFWLILFLLQYLKFFYSQTRLKTCKCTGLSEWGSWIRFKGTFQLDWSSFVEEWHWQGHW